MVSQTFSLGEESRKGICTKILLLVVLAAVVAAAVLAGIYAFRSTGQSGCDSPELDPNGLSNYMSGAKTVVFSCFPGFFVDQATADGSNMVTSHCQNNQWVPEPPTCNYLPIRIDCQVGDNGLHGNISMMQLALDQPTTIVGLVNFTQALRAPGHINELLPLTRHASHCQESQVYNLTEEIAQLSRNESKYVIKVLFRSNELAAYRKADVRVQMIYLDSNTIAAIISVTQGNRTLVMPSSDVPKITLPQSIVDNNEEHNSTSSESSESGSSDSTVLPKDETEATAHYQ